jgi:peroxiredoxin
VVSSAELLKDGPLIVTPYRGIWCPYCREDLKDLAGAVPQIRACGASLVAIAHQTAPGSNGKFQREHGLEFPILDDRRGDVAVAYRIRSAGSSRPEGSGSRDRDLGETVDALCGATEQLRFVFGRVA